MLESDHKFALKQLKKQFYFDFRQVKKGCNCAETLENIDMFATKLCEIMKEKAYNLISNEYYFNPENKITEEDYFYHSLSSLSFSDHEEDEYGELTKKYRVYQCSQETNSALFEEFKNITNNFIEKNYKVDEIRDLEFQFSLSR